MAGQFDAFGRHQAFLAFAIRAGLKAGAVLLSAGITVMCQQRNGVIDLFLHRERPSTLATLAQPVARLLQKIGFAPHRQFILLRERNRRCRAHFFAAGAENAAPEIKLPGQFASREIGFYR
jgi:hypothetical protein